MDTKKTIGLEKDKLYVCDRCKITPTKKRDTMCPCPRGGCEARQVSVPKKMYSRADVLDLINKYGNMYYDYPQQFVSEFL